MFSQIGPLEIVLVIVVLLIVFGPKRLPSLGRSLGTGMREFKDSVTGQDKQGSESDAPDRPALSQAQADVPPPASAGVAAGGESAPEQRA